MRAPESVIPAGPALLRAHAAAIDCCCASMPCPALPCQLCSWCRSGAAWREHPVPGAWRELAACAGGSPRQQFFHLAAAELSFFSIAVCVVLRHDSARGCAWGELRCAAPWPASLLLPPRVPCRTRGCVLPPSPPLHLRARDPHWCCLHPLARRLTQAPACAGACCRRQARRFPWKTRTARCISCSE